MGDYVNASAGWYPDPAPRGEDQRRYWDGERWTDEVAELEIDPEPTPRWVWIIAGVFVLNGLIQAVNIALDGEWGAALFSVGLAVAAAGWAWWCHRPYLRDIRDLRLQQEDDRRRALAINAEREHKAYLRGDDELAVYGQFPPPSELLDDDR